MWSRLSGQKKHQSLPGIDPKVKRAVQYDMQSLHFSPVLLSYAYTVRINLPLFSTVVPTIIFVFLSCRPLVAITTLSTGLVGVVGFSMIQLSSDK